MVAVRTDYNLLKKLKGAKSTLPAIHPTQHREDIHNPQRRQTALQSGATKPPQKQREQQDDAVKKVMVKPQTVKNNVTVITPYRSDVFFFFLQ